MQVTEFTSIWEWILGLFAFVLMIITLLSLIVLYVVLIPVNLIFWLIGSKDWNNTKPLYYLNKFCEDLLG